MSWIQKLTRKGEQLFGIFKKAIDQGLSFNRFYRLARKLGISYRRQDMLRDWNIIRGAKKVINTIKYVPRNKVITPRHYIPVSKITGGNYATTFRVEAINQRTGERVIKYITIVHDQPMRRDQLEYRVVSRLKLGEEEGSDPLLIKKLVPVRGFRVA